MPICPACHADLDDPASAASRVTECPFCGTSLYRAEPAEADAITGTAPAGQEPKAIAAPPPKSRIEVVEKSLEQFAVHIPPGGANTAGLGCFALAWNGFMCVFTPPWFLGFGEGDGPPLYFLVPFLLLFWAIGLGMAYAWARMRFTRTYFLLEPERLVIQTQRFGKKHLEEAPLLKESRARLVESYQMNDVPVHRIDIQAEGHVFRFGTRLSEDEKEWLSQSINRFLGRDRQDVATEAPRFCWSCGASLDEVDIDSSNACPNCGETIERIRRNLEGHERVVSIPRFPRSGLPPESTIRVVTDGPDELHFTLPLLPDGKVRRWISVVLTIVGSVWVAVSGAFLLQVAFPPGRPLDWFKLLFRLFPFVPGLLVLVVGLSIRRARITVRLTPDWLKVRYHLGPFGKGKSLSTPAIEAVRLRVHSELHGTGQNAGLPLSDESVLASVHIGERSVPLTTLHGREEAALVAGLVKERLQKYGATLDN